MHENTVRNWSRTGVLEAVQLPGSKFRRFREQDVERLAREREQAHSKKRLGAPEFVDAAYLDSWGGRRAEELLPHLVRRLLAGTPGIVGVTMRAEEGIRAAGWDGEVDDCPGTAWVPRGPSRWEMGTGSDPRGKAQSDYEKRSEEPLGVDPAATTFVFVTQRRWPNSQDWVRERKADGIWRDVRVIDADQLSGWLEASPSVHLWFSEQVGLRPLDVRTLEAWWERFARQTRPPLPADLLLAGRARAEAQLQEHVRGAPAPIAVEGRSREEVVAFVAATLLGIEEKDRPAAVVARSARGWERLSLSESPMVLLPDTEEEVDVQEAVSRGHHAIIPARPGDSPNLARIELPPIDRMVALEAFEAAGHPLSRAGRLAVLARRSFPALLRDPEIAVSARSRPPWAQGEHAHRVASLLLVGAWDAREADQGIVEKVVGPPWDDIEREIRTWLRTDDPPLVEHGGVWRVASPEGSWAVLEDALSQSALQRFCAAAEEVLLEIDPASELPAEERPMAGLRGMTREFSPTLRRGLAQGLALLGAFGDKPVSGAASAGDHARGVVHILMARANADESGGLWASLSDQLPLLAEAAPDEFLAGLELGLAGDGAVVGTMFQDRERGSVLFASSPHTGLLWALETICWSPDYLPGAAIELARLAELDPGGQLSNRPEATLRSIFLPWLPQTSASLELRFQVLDSVVERYPDVGWRLMLSLLPKSHDSSSHSSSPRFRDWVPSQLGATLQERLEAVAGLVDRLVEAAADRFDRWGELVEHLGPLPKGQRELLFDRLEQLPIDGATAADRLALWNKLSDEIGRHRSYPEAQWSIDDDSLSRLEALNARIEPKQAVERHARLFDWRPEIPHLERADYAQWQEGLAKVRAEAVGEVLALDETGALERLASASPQPRFVGISAAEVAGDDLTAQMVPLLGKAGADGQMASGWVAQMAWQGGEDWIGTMGERLPDWSPDQQAAFLLALRPGRFVWTLVDIAPEEASSEYWRVADLTGVDTADVEEAGGRLVESERPWAAIDLLSLHCSPHAKGDAAPSKELVAKVLDSGLQAQSADDRTRVVSAGYEIGVLLDYLEGMGADLETMARLEWAYFPLTEDAREPRALYGALGQDPSLFVELVSRVFRGKGEAKRDLDERAAALASHSWSVLDAWRRLPGLMDDDTIDGEHLRQWVREARLALADSDRGDVGDQQIGQLLSGSPPGVDGAWPAEPVRDLIEDIASPDLETGLEIGEHNARGVTSRGVYDGGDQERERSNEFAQWAAVVGAKWPRANRMLLRFADYYERQARNEDIRAQRRASED